jgi:hypothetical protein
MKAIVASALGARTISALVTPMRPMAKQRRNLADSAPMADQTFEPVHLENYVDGHDVGHRVVRFEDHLWYVKPVNDYAVLGREVLAARLGAGVVNVVGTRRVTDPSQLIKSDGSSWTAEGPYELMSRLVDTYALEDLPIADADRVSLSSWCSACGSDGGTRMRGTKRM